MNKYTIRMEESSYKKLQKKLQKYEIKIGGMNIRNFLIANSNIDDIASPTDIRIKRIILHINGDFDCRPEDLHHGIQFKINLGFAHKEFLLLRKRLDKLAKDYDKQVKIMSADVTNCQTIKDCIEMVNSKISEKIQLHDD